MIYNTLRENWYTKCAYIVVWVKYKLVFDSPIRLIKDDDDVQFLLDEIPTIDLRYI